MTNTYFLYINHSFNAKNYATSTRNFLNSSQIRQSLAISFSIIFILSIRTEFNLTITEARTEVRTAARTEART